MAINIKQINEYNGQYLLLFILQIMAICNAMKEGWKVKKIGQRTYEFTKIIPHEEDVDLEDFIQRITAY